MHASTQNSICLSSNIRCTWEKKGEREREREQMLTCVVFPHPVSPDISTTCFQKSGHIRKSLGIRSEGEQKSK